MRKYAPCKEKVFYGLRKKNLTKTTRAEKSIFGQIQNINNDDGIDDGQGSF
jgi:hypothetical protein